MKRENKASIKPALSHINQRDAKETGARTAQSCATVRPVDFTNGRSTERDVDIVETKERKGNNNPVQGASGGEVGGHFFFYTEKTLRRSGKLKKKVEVRMESRIVNYGA